MNDHDNSIEKQIEIKAPVSKVWRALTDSNQFSQWFNIKMEGPFVAGQTVRGKNGSKGHDHMVHDFQIKAINPESYFSYAWVPYPFDKTVDYNKEEPTLVEFFLEPSSIGTLLRVKESGFNKVTASRRALAFKMHTGGWEAQLKNVEAFVVEKK